jgi:hypothetical protein
MKNITFTADESLIEAAREQARADQTTLNEQFRQWLEPYARKRQAARAPSRRASSAFRPCRRRCRP